MAEFMIKQGDRVSVGLTTHECKDKAWNTFPSIGVTHQWVDDPESLGPEEISDKFYEVILLPMLNNSKTISGKVLEVREDDWGGHMALVELGNGKRRWFMPHLLRVRE